MEVQKIGTHRPEESRQSYRSGRLHRSHYSDWNADGSEALRRLAITPHGYATLKSVQTECRREMNKVFATPADFRSVDDMHHPACHG